MTNAVQSLGGQFVAQGSRDTATYQAVSYAHATPEVVSLLADTALAPLFAADEVEAQRDAAVWDARELKAKPEVYLPELLHEVAWHRNTLGNPLVCSETQLRSLTPDALARFHADWYGPSRIVIAGVGVPHDAFVRDVERALEPHADFLRRSQAVSAPPVEPPAPVASTSGSSSARRTQSRPLSTSAGVLATAVDGFVNALGGVPISRPGTTPYAPTTSVSELATRRAVYTGGVRYEQAADVDFNRLYVAFEGLAISDPDLYALATLHTLLGGGGSFSAGGPGKGMYSRLYTAVLNQYHGVDHCQAVHQCYLDSGIFGIHIATTDAFLPRAARLVSQQLASTLKSGAGGGIGDRELQRAKNQLRSHLVRPCARCTRLTPQLFSLENRQVQVEDLGRQVLQLGRREPDEEMCGKIDAVSLADVRRVAERVLTNSPPTVLAHGRLAGLGDVTSILRQHGLGLQR